MGGWLAKADAAVNASIASGAVAKGAVDIRDLVNIAPGAWKDMIAKGAVEGRVDIKDLIASGAVAKGAVEGRVDIKDLIASEAVAKGAVEGRVERGAVEGVVKDLVHSGAVDFGQMLAEGAIRGTVRMDASAHDLIQKGAFSSEVKVQDLFPELKEIVGFKLPLDELARHISKHMTGILWLLVFVVACNASVAVLNSHNFHLFSLPAIPVYIKYGTVLALLITFFLPVLRTWWTESNRRRRFREQIASEMKKAAFAPVPPLPFDLLTCGVNVVLMRSCGQKLVRPKSVRYVCTVNSIERTADGGFAILSGCRPTCKSDRLLNESHVMSVTKEWWDGPSSLVRPVTRMLIYGATGAGKTSLLRGLGVALPDGAITKAPKGTTKEVNSWFHTVGSHLFEFVDVPGVGDGDVRPPTVMRDLANMYTESSFQGVILVLRIKDDRMGSDGEVVARLLRLALGANTDSWLQRVYFVVTHMDCVTSKEAELARIKTMMVPTFSEYLGGTVPEENIVEVGLGNYFKLERVLLKAASKLTALQYRHVSTDDMIDVYSKVSGVDAREKFWKDHHKQMQQSLRAKLSAIMATSSAAPRSVSPSHMQSLLAEAEELGIHDEFQGVVRQLADWEVKTLRCLRSIEVMVDQCDFDAAFEGIQAEVQQLPFDTRLEIALGHAGVKQVEWQCSKIKGEVSKDMRRKLHEQQDKMRKDLEAAEASHQSLIEGLRKQLKEEKQETAMNLKQMKSKQEKERRELRKRGAKNLAEEARKRQKLESDQQRQNKRVEQLERDLAEAKKPKHAGQAGIGGISFKKFHISQAPGWQLSPGWRLATAEEVRANKDKVARLLNHWDICKLAGGFKFDGASYGNKISRSGPDESIGHCVAIAH